MSERWREAYKRQAAFRRGGGGADPGRREHRAAGGRRASRRRCWQAIADGARERRFTNLTMRALLPFVATKATVLQPDVQDVIRWESLFVGGADRGAVQAGRATSRRTSSTRCRACSPSSSRSTSFIAARLADGQARLHEPGHVGRVHVDGGARGEELMLLETDEHMPRIHGRSFIHISEATAVVENNAPLPELPTPAPRPEDEAIGGYIAEMVPDGATIQLGIGGIPNAVAKFLHGPQGPRHPHRDVHRQHGRHHRGRHRDRREEDAPSAEGRLHVRRRLRADVPLPRRQPALRDAPGLVHERPGDDRAQQPADVGERGDRGRPHGPGLRGIDGACAVQRHRRAGGLRARRVQLAGRQELHRALLDARSRARSRASCRRSRRAPS